MRHTRHVALILLAITLLVGIPISAAETVTFQPATATINPGSTANITVTLSEAPSGLAGYEMVIRFSRSGVAGITEVSYPSWALLFNTTRYADGSVRISGVDINRQVEAGSTGITLATMTIQGLSGGTSSILMESVIMDADGGAIISPNLSVGQVSVPGGGGTSSGGGGGGGSGDSFVSTTTRTPTPSATSSPTQTLTGSQPTPSQATTQVTIQPSTDTIPETPAVTPAASVVTGEQEAIPWGLIVLGIVLFGVVLVVAFIAWQKERKE